MALAGLKDAVTPAGNPDTARFTAPLKPCCVLMVMVLTPLPPAAIESVDADEARLNAGAFDAPVRLLIKGWPGGTAPSGGEIVTNQSIVAAVVSAGDVVKVASITRSGADAVDHWIEKSNPRLFDWTLPADSPER